MTSTPLAPPAVPRTRPRTAASPARRTLRAVAIAACLPYLALKISWIAGGRLGIPDRSALLDEPGVMVVANSVTVLMDACVIVLALLLTQGWGRRVAAPLLVLPMWAASGLLAPIMVGFPLQLLAGGSIGVAPGEGEPFLESWVFGVVYGGFIVQGLALGALFVLYARERWGHLWRGTVGELPRPSRTVRAVGLVAALLAALCSVPHLFEAVAGRAVDVAEPLGSDARLVTGVHGAFALAAFAGLLMLVLGLGGRVPLRVPLALTWTGVGVLACWGGWMLVTAGAVATGADRLTTLTVLTYAVQVITGLLALAGGTSFFVQRQRRLAA
ncbi:hypothetical protein ACH4SP_18610 [Streptomyces sp. NPDC021093]|uniref:hypothetical protein n=1 Tax=Streptomyces sp. NPDC021093 TaxID=3365112 RepID=UPI003794AFBF